jgi:spore germination cell wall hydrolase CwlJ-like protein
MKRLLLRVLLVSLFVPAFCHAGVIADTMYMECRSESNRGQMAVASVIYSRAKQSGKTYKQVCLARKQFSCWNRGYYSPTPKTKLERKKMAGFLAIESSMVNNTFKPTGDWNHYHTTRVNPIWSKSMKGSVVIGNHKFGKIFKLPPYKK